MGKHTNDEETVEYQMLRDMVKQARQMDEEKEDEAWTLHRQNISVLENANANMNGGTPAPGGEASQVVGPPRGTTKLQMDFKPKEMLNRWSALTVGNPWDERHRNNKTSICK